LPSQHQINREINSCNSQQKQVLLGSAEEHGNPTLHTIETRIPLSQCAPAHISLQKVRKQCPWQQNGEEIDYTDKNFYGAKLVASLRRPTFGPYDPADARLALSRWAESDWLLKHDAATFNGRN
jgi:hypothetical protein